MPTPPKICASAVFSSQQLHKRIDYEHPANPAGGIMLGKYATGMALGDDEFPDRLFYSSRVLSSRNRKTTDVFKILNALVVVSERTKEVLEQFNLGQTRLHERPLYEFDREIRLPDRLFLLNIGETRDCFEPQACGGGRQSDNGYWYLKSLAKDVAIRPPDDDIDLWMDPTLLKVCFLSDRLVKGLKAEKIRGFAPFRCTIVD